MPRLREDLRDRSGLDDLAVLHHADDVADLQRAWGMLTRTFLGQGSWRLPWAAR
jgi:hypothetical protein